MTEIEFGDIRQIVDRLIVECEDKIDRFSLDFLKRVYSTNFSIYVRRLNAIGFRGLGQILDAGCGFGQWTIPLAALNNEVTSLDIASDRLLILDKIIRIANINNVKTKHGSLENLPFRESSFDGIFCYSALIYSSWKETLNEFRRVLKDDGILYLNANGLGWYIYLWKNEPNKSEGYDPRKYTAHALLNTLKYAKDEEFDKKFGLIIEQKDLLNELVKRNFEVIEVNDEGTINRSNDKIESFFNGVYEGNTGVFEILARKNG